MPTQAEIDARKATLALIKAGFNQVAAFTSTGAAALIDDGGLDLVPVIRAFNAVAIPLRDVARPEIVKAIDDANKMVADGIPMAKKDQAITSFTLTPLSINEGTAASLSWATARASAVYLNGVKVAPSSTMNVAPAVTTFYKLEVDGSGPRLTQSLTLTVVPVVVPPPAPTITNLTATPSSLPAGGGTVTINAAVANATTLTLNGNSVALPVTILVTATKSFTLAAHGATAPDASASVSITVADPLPSTGPAWLAGRAVGVAATIPGTSLQALLGTAYADMAIVEAWGGMAASDSRLYFTLNGGHGDSSRNGAEGFNALDDAPKWTVLRASSDPAVIPVPPNDAGYYGDGRPVSRHSYFAPHFLKSRNEIVHAMLGSIYGSGNATPQVDAFDLTTNDYKPAGTYPNGPLGVEREGVVCKNPATDELIVGYNWVWYKRAPDGTWSGQLPNITNKLVGFKRGALVDVARNRMVVPGSLTDGGVLALQCVDLTTFAITSIALTGVTGEANLSGPHIVHDTDANVYYIACSSGRIFKVDPVTGVTVKIATLPAANNGIWSRFAYLPAVKGLVYLPTYASDVWFIPLGTATGGGTTPTPDPLPTPDPTPDPDPTPTPDPTPLPAPGTASIVGRVPALGRAFASDMNNCGPADWFDPTTFPAPVSFPPELLFAPAQNGVAPAAWTMVHLYGNKPNLYDAIPYFDGDRIRQSNTQDSDSANSIVLALQKKGKHMAGKRGECIVSPYVTRHGHEIQRDDGTLNLNAPLFCGMREDCTMVFDFSWGVSESPKQPYKASTDFSYDPDDRFTFLFPALFEGKLVEVDRRPAFAVTPGVGAEDMTKWARTETHAGLTKPTSCRRVPGGRTFFTQFNNGADAGLYEALPDGTVKLVLAIPYAHFVDYEVDDAGKMSKLVVITLGTVVYRFHPDAPDVAEILAPVNAVAYTDLDHIFIVIKTDKTGACGPKNAAYISRSHGVGNTDSWRLTGTRFDYKDAWLPSGRGRATVGNSLYVIDIEGHYNWDIAPAVRHCLIAMCGFSSGIPSFVRAKLPTDPPENSWDIDGVPYNNGFTLLQLGCADPAKLGTVPSFTAQQDRYGWSLLGVTPDWICSLSFDDRLKFLQQGGLGIFPRDYDGYAAYCCLYFWERSSLQYLKEGKARLDKLNTWAKAKWGWATIPSQVFPFIQSTTDTWLDVVDTGTKLTTRTSDYYVPAEGDANGRAKPPADPAMQVNVVVDEGTLEQQVIGPMTLGAMFDRKPGLHTYRALPLAGKFWSRAQIA